MALIDYTYYTGTFKGNVVPSSEFDRLALRASEYIDFITQGQYASTEYATQINKATCAVAEVIFKTEGTADKTSESYTGYSVSYDRVETNRMKFKVVKPYLALTGLLYCGEI